MSISEQYAILGPFQKKPRLSFLQIPARSVFLVLSASLGDTVGSPAALTGPKGELILDHGVIAANITSADDRQMLLLFEGQDNDVLS